MIFTETKLAGAFLVDLQRLVDGRGFFARTWCKREFRQHIGDSDLAQCNISFNTKTGTLRGLHYQAYPYEEAKLVRCTMGAVYDVIVDLRTESPTFKQWFSVILTATNRKMIYVPKGLAHGFLTLEDDTEVFYQMSEFYSAEHSKGIRWDDPVFGILWPRQVAVISHRDANYGNFGA